MTLASRLRTSFWLATLAAALSATASAQGPQAPATFRAARELVSLDAVVRDRSGNVVRGLTPADFEIREDGAPQDLLTLSFEEIDTRAVPLRDSTLLAGMDARVRSAVSGTSAAAQPSAPREVSLAGRRPIVLLFDLTTMEPEDVQRSVDAAAGFVAGRMSPADVVAIVTFGVTLDVLTDFTDDRSALLAILRRLGASGDPDVPAAAPPPDVEVSAADAIDLYNNDARLRAMRVLADALAPIEQKKSVLYFSAGMDAYGEDNQIELRAAANAAVRANLAIYPVDTRGLQVVIPGGTAREPSSGGQGLFSGRQVQQQFDQLAESQDTLVALAADTGGRAFLNSNDFAAPFVRVQRDTAAYYLLGYSSTNESRDGRFRRVQVRVTRPGLEVEARKGYFAARDFAHTSRVDREIELQEQLDTDASSTDVPLIVSSGWFRMSPERYYVPVSLAIPGSALLRAAGSGASSRDRVSVDVLGLVRDEQRRAVVRIRETVEVPSGTSESLAKQQLLYQTGATLPPGRFSVKVVVRENGGGAVGSFESPLVVPDLRRAPLRMSSVVLSTQVEPWTRGRTDNPLVRQGVHLLPNLTHVVRRDQKVFFYFEVYDPVATASAPPLVRTSVAFYRGKVKVLETPVVERSTVDDASRMASIFQFELPPRTLAAGLYTCQINVIDAGAGTFAFPRLTVMVQ